MARRAFEIGGAIAVWQQRGHAAAFATFTMRHHVGHRLKDLWQALTGAWHKVTAGKAWVQDRSRYGVVGWLRVVEVTYGSNGWHVHTHVVLFLDEPLGRVGLAELHRRMFARWSASLVDSGLGVPLMSGQDCHPVTGPADESLAAYFTKATDQGHRLGLELTGSQTKRVRGALGTAPTWRFLDLVAGGDADALDLWHEWEKASHRRRQISWSNGLRHLLGVMREQSDEEIAAEEVGTSNDDLVFITAEGWRQLLGVQSLSLADVLTTTEAQGLPGLRGLLDAHGVEYRVMGEASAA